MKKLALIIIFLISISVVIAQAEEPNPLNAGPKTYSIYGEGEILLDYETDPNSQKSNRLKGRVEGKPIGLDVADIKGLNVVNDEPLYLGSGSEMFFNDDGEIMEIRGTIVGKDGNRPKFKVWDTEVEGTVDRFVWESEYSLDQRTANRATIDFKDDNFGKIGSLKVEGFDETIDLNGPSSSAVIFPDSRIGLYEIGEGSNIELKGHELIFPASDNLDTNLLPYREFSTYVHFQEKNGEKLLNVWHSERYLGIIGNQGFRFKGLDWGDNTYLDLKKGAKVTYNLDKKYIYEADNEDFSVSTVENELLFNVPGKLVVSGKEKPYYLNSDGGLSTIRVLKTENEVYLTQLEGIGELKTGFATLKFDSNRATLPVFETPKEVFSEEEPATFYIDLKGRGKISIDRPFEDKANIRIIGGANNVIKLIPSTGALEYVKKEIFSQRWPSPIHHIRYMSSDRFEKLMKERRLLLVEDKSGNAFYSRDKVKLGGFD